MLTIDIQTARRFILGRQGLWPGRRWGGNGSLSAGIEQAMRAVEYLQLDPLQIIARSHDILLHSRVLGYAPGGWETVTYQERRFFDWGGWLAARPMEELPFWRVAMRRERETNRGLQSAARDHAAAVEEMRQILRERGTVSNRDFEMAARTRTRSYRGSKDSSVALYYLWRTGEAMTHHRERFERVYALTEAVAPEHLIYESSEAEADRFLLLKDVRFLGLARLIRSQAAHLHRDPEQNAAALLASGDLVEVQVEGWKQVHYAAGSDAPLLDELAVGRLPAGWDPLETTTTDEAVFLAPLDPVSARGRAKLLFGFDYTWDVYKPVHLRKYGYYTLPVLWGEQLAARFDSKLDRAAGTLVILGLWLEDDALCSHPALADALGRGFARFARFLGARKVDASPVRETLLRKAITAVNEELAREEPPNF